MSKYTVTNYDFENAKQHIREFSEQAPISLELSSVYEHGGFLDLFDHQVTGKEFNNLVTQLQDRLMHINQREDQVSKEFGQVYNALESLNEDYIEGIVAAMITAHEADSKAKAVETSLGKTNATLGNFFQYQTEQNQKFSQSGLYDYDRAIYNSKLKTAYCLAGGAIALTILQFILNMIGII